MLCSLYYFLCTFFSNCKDVVPDFPATNCYELALKNGFYCKFKASPKDTPLSKLFLERCKVSSFFPTSTKAVEKLNCLDLFGNNTLVYRSITAAGCGGLSYGMERCGVITCKWAVELNTDAAGSYKVNHPSCHVVQVWDFIFAE